MGSENKYQLSERELEVTRLLYDIFLNTAATALRTFPPDRKLLILDVLHKELTDGYRREVAHMGETGLESEAND